MRTAPGDVVFALDVFAPSGQARALVEHGDGRWSICTINKQLQERVKNRPIDAQCTFDINDLLAVAEQAFTGNPAIKDNPHAGRQLAAGVLMLSMAMGLVQKVEGNGE